jgi:hypothetical protein
MEGYVVTYNPTTGQITVDVDTTIGAGTYSIWDINLQASLPDSNEFPFSNLDVDIGTEDVDTVATSLASRVEWEYHIVKGANSRSGTIIAGLNGSNTVAVDTSDVSGGNIRLRATATSNDWIVRGLRRIIST